MIPVFSMLSFFDSKQGSVDLRLFVTEAGARAALESVITDSYAANDPDYVPDGLAPDLEAVRASPLPVSWDDGSGEYSILLERRELEV